MWFIQKDSKFISSRTKKSSQPFYLSVSDFLTDELLNRLNQILVKFFLVRCFYNKFSRRENNMLPSTFVPMSKTNKKIQQNIGTC